MGEEVHSGEESAFFKLAIPVREYTKSHESIRLFLEDAVNEVASNYEEGQADKSLLRLSVEYSKWLNIPVHELYVVVDIGHGVQAPGRHLVSPVKLGVTVNHVGFPVYYHSQGQDHYEYSHVTVDYKLHNRAAVSSSVQSLVDHIVGKKEGQDQSS